MITKQIYYENPDQTTLESKVVSVKNTDKGQEVILDQTIFFPQGGGQPADTGFLGDAIVEKVKTVEGEIIHFVKGDLHEGDVVTAKIDFDHRQKYVKIHSAGHLIHDLVASLNSDLKPLKGEHGDNAYLEYTGEFKELTKEELETKVANLAKTRLVVITKPVTYEEMVKECPIIQDNLPKDKALRMLKIGNFPGMPDGGLQVKTTDEIGQININELTVKDGKTLIKYSIGQEKKVVVHGKVPKLFIFKEVKEKFPELEEVLMPVFGLEVHKDESILTEKDFRTDDVLNKPEIKAFREFFAEFGVDVKKTPPSVEHLYQRFIKTGRVPHINNVVDICNKVAVETLIPTGVFDLDKIKGDMVMRYSYENEEFHALGGDIEKLPAGLVVIADEEKILNLFPARDSMFQNVTENTKNVMILADKVAGISLEKTKEAVFKIGELLGGNKEDLFVSEVVNIATKKPIVKRNIHLKNIATDIMRKAGSTYKFLDEPINVPVKETVPTIVFRTEKGFIAAQRRADTKINFNKLKLLAGVSELALANEEDLAQLGAEYGVVPLVGLPMPYFVDKMVMDIKQVFGGSGEKLFALTLPSKELARVNNATVGDFAEVDKTAGQKKRIYGGMRPTGFLHLGNYLGGAKGFLALQDREDFECFYQVVQYHGITTPYKPESYKRTVRGIFLDYLAAGLDPKKCHISEQLDEHIILAYLLSTIYQVSRLEDLPTYKDKKFQHPDYVNMGLLYYPVLMAADIMCYKGELVPVGIDQEPHIEVTREIVRKFNMMFGDTFPEPKRFDTPGRYVPSLLGEGKMSKSVEGSYIALTDDLATIKAKLAKAPTDSGKGETFPQSGGVANLVTFVELFEGRDKAQQLREQYKTTGIRYGDLKAGLAEAIFNELKPIQEKRAYFEAHPELVEAILAEGKEYSQKIARETLTEVREKMGLI